MAEGLVGQSVLGSCRGGGPAGDGQNGSIQVIVATAWRSDRRNEEGGGAMQASGAGAREQGQLGARVQVELRTRLWVGVRSEGKVT